MSEHIEFVNAIAQSYRNQAEMTKDSARREHFARMFKRLEAVSADLVRLYGLTSALPPELGNIFDLPSELREELSITKSDELEDQLVTVINAYGGAASLDQILVGLYRKFGVKQKRRLVQNKLYRMTMVWSVPRKKGVYTIEQPEDDPNDDPGGEVDLERPVEDIIVDTSASVEEEEDESPF